MVQKSVNTLRECYKAERPERVIYSQNSIKVYVVTTTILNCTDYNIKAILPITSYIKLFIHYIILYYLLKYSNQ